MGLSGSRGFSRCGSRRFYFLLLYFSSGSKGWTFFPLLYLCYGDPEGQSKRLGEGRPFVEGEGSPGGGGPMDPVPDVVAQVVAGVRVSVEVVEVVTSCPVAVLDRRNPGAGLSTVSVLVPTRPRRPYR